LGGVAAPPPWLTGRSVRPHWHFFSAVKPRIHGVLAEPLFDAQELIAFRQTIGAAEGAWLDLAAVRRHRDGALTIIEAGWGNWNAWDLADRMTLGKKSVGGLAQSNQS
jgi:hypothetical protein